MKCLLTAIFLILTASQANADGFYQMVTGDRPAWGTGTPSHITEFTPLYQRVTEDSRRLAMGENTKSVTEWTYTPLYLQVTGIKPGSVRKESIVNRDIGASTGS